MAKSKGKTTEATQTTDRRWIIRPRYLFLFFLLMTFILAGVYISQRSKLSSIAQEKESLQATLDGLTVEKERLEQMLEYMETDDYLEQYAREKLGYVYPDDIKFSDSDTSYTSPLATAVPTSMPESTADLRPSPTPAPTLPPTPTPTLAPQPSPTDGTSIVIVGGASPGTPVSNTDSDQVVTIG